MSRDRLILSYHDADIYERDQTLFQRGCWLNDSCINFYLKTIIHEATSSFPMEMKDTICLLDPAVVQFIRLQCTDEEEFEDLRISLNLTSKSWMIAPINDNESFESESSHWSTLFIHIPSRLVFHYDSFGKRNLTSARNLTNILSVLFYWFVNAINNLPTNQ
jgi:Ulp1 family protease